MISTPLIDLPDSAGNSMMDIPSSQRPRVIRQRPDLEDVPAPDRRANDHTAQDIYQQLWLNAIREDRDPNNSDEEVEYEGYVPPVVDVARGKMVQEIEQRRVKAAQQRREAALKQLRASAAHKDLSAFDRLMAESECYHGGKDHRDDDDEDNPRCFLTETPRYIKGELRPYQIEGVNWLLGLFNHNVNGILADEMGLGKTFQTIATIAYLRFTYGLPGPHLVVVPKSVLGNWFREFRRWCPALSIYKFHGSHAIRPSLIQLHLRPPLRYDVVLTTFDMILYERTAFGRIQWNYLIVDEAHKLKNNESTSHTVLDCLRTQHRLLLTGTPLQNSLIELWALLHFLAPILFTDSRSFDEWFDARDRLDESAVSRMHFLLEPMMIRRLKTDVKTGIPPKKEIYVKCQLSSRQRSWYLTTLARDAEALNRATGGSTTQLNNILMQLCKVCNHPYLMPGGEDGPPFKTDENIIKASGKMVLLDKLLEKLYKDKDGKHKILIFCQMTTMLDIIEDYLTNLRPQYQFCRIDGSTNGLDRDQQMAAFNNPNSDKFLFLLSTRAGGLGINLQTANHVILYDSDWNPQMDLQAQDRAHRIGQTRSVRVYRFITDDTVEERIYQRALKKLYLDAMVVQQGRIASAANSKVSREEMLSMIRFGAEKTFSSRKGDVTEEDIDALLQQGEERMDELQRDAQSSTQQSLASFKFGATENGLYDFEGLDYTHNSGVMTRIVHITLPEPISQDELYERCSKFGEVINCSLHPDLKEAVASFRTQQGATDCVKNLGLPCAFATRKNKVIVSDDMINEYSSPISERLGRGQRAINVTEIEEREETPRINIKLPRRPNYPYYQLYNMPRLLHLWESECSLATRNARRQAAAHGTPFEEERPTETELEEKERLLEEGFDRWSHDDYKAFLGAITSGEANIRDYAKVATLMGGRKTEGEVREYTAAFLERGPNIIPRFEFIEARIRNAEAKVQAAKDLREAARWKMETSLDGDLKISSSKDKLNADLDRRLFIAAYDNDMNREKAAEIVANDPHYRFDIFMRSRGYAYLNRRIKTVLNTIKREWEKSKN